MDLMDLLQNFFMSTGRFFALVADWNRESYFQLCTADCSAYGLGFVCRFFLPPTL